MKPRSSGTLPTRTFQRLLLLTFLIALTGIILSPALLWADWVATCDYRGNVQFGDHIATAHFGTEAECQAAISAQGYQTGRCNCAESDPGTGGSSPAPSGGTDMNSAVQSAYTLGEAIGNQIRADDAAAKARADELERERIEKERQAAEEKRLKYESSKTELLNNLRDSAPDSGGGLREVGSSGDNSGLRDVGSGEGFMQAPAPKRPKVKHVVNFKHLATPTPVASPTPVPKPTRTPEPKKEDSGVQHADIEKDGVQLTGEPENDLKDQIWVENTNADPVDIHVWMAGESSNSAHSLRNNIHLEPGERVQVGWAGNTTNEDPWNYQLGMNVTKK